MKRTSKIVAAWLLCFLVGCGAYLMPRWVVDLGNWKFQSVAFAAADNSSLYRVSRSGSEAIEVEQFDLQGAKIQAYSIPYPFSFFSVSDLVRAPGNAFYLPIEEFGRVLYSDPDTQASWVGVKTDLAAEQIPSIRHGQVNDEGDLVFIGWTRKAVGDADPVWEPGVGRIGRDGYLKSYNILADVGDIYTLYKNDRGGFDAVSSLPRREDGVAPQAFLEFDARGNLVQRTDSQREINIYGYARHRWVGEIDGEMGVFDNTGKHLLAMELGQDYGFQSVDVENGFYTLGTGVSVGSEPMVCFYNAQYVRQWCNMLTELAPYSFSSRQHRVDAEGRLLLSFGLERKRLISAGVDIQSFMKGVYGDFEVRGEERRELRHIVFDTKGKRILQAQAEPYFHQGVASLCFLELCVDKEKIHPGFGGFSDSLLLPGGRIYSFSSLWNGESNSDSYQEQLLYWGP